MPRTLALDVGSRRIGVALTDDLHITAQPLLTLHRSAPRADLKSIARLIRRYAVDTVVVGLPLHADGAESPQAAKTRHFADLLRGHLAKALPAHGFPLPTLEFLDERHTTAEAHALLDRTLGPRRTAADREARTHLIDQAAATLLLTAWLERHHGPTLLPDPDAPS